MKFINVASVNKLKTLGTDEILINLVDSSWDDWFKYETTYRMYLVSNDKGTIEIGYLKIGQKGQNYRRIQIQGGQIFDSLSDDCFSLGQDDTYYENLKQHLSKAERESLLKSLRDIAFDTDIYNDNKSEDVMFNSLMRSVEEQTLLEQFNRISHGGAQLTPYQFNFTVNEYYKDFPSQIEFSVSHESTPATNIHVLVGRNGVGKTYLMNGFIESLTTKDDRKCSYEGSEFSSLVVCSYSAFDEKFPVEIKDSLKPYNYIGIKKLSDDGIAILNKSTDELTQEFQKAVKTVVLGPREELWIETLKKLKSDPIFKSVNVEKLCDYKEDKDELARQTEAAFEKLSSGHKIILLTITKLVQLVREKTLIILDEPEGHLHPPLLSAFIKSLSYLLREKNGVAIIATHSPVVLQEVPSSCVWRITRERDLKLYHRLNIECFGENVGVLTHEVFGLEVIYSGYNTLLREISDEFDDYDKALLKLGGTLGNEGRSMLKSFIANR